MAAFTLVSLLSSASLQLFAEYISAWSILAVRIAKFGYKQNHLPFEFKYRKVPFYPDSSFLLFSNH